MSEKIQKDDAIELLLDPEYEDNIILYNERDEAVEFEQVAIIVYKKNTYAILHPVDGEKHGVGEDEALVFKLHRNYEGDAQLLLESDEKIIDAVFEKYYKLYDEEN